MLLGLQTQACQGNIDGILVDCTMSEKHVPVPNHRYCRTSTRDPESVSLGEVDNRSTYVSEQFQPFFGWTKVKIRNQVLR